jgi:hypothetical protein
MNLKRFIFFTTLLLTVVSIGCRDKDLYPLPYDDREVGAYMRFYSQTSNIIDLNDLANSGLDGVFEAVDENGGNNVQEFRIFVSHRRGTAVSSERLVKTIPGTAFTKVPEPTFSEYTRAKVRVTAAETLTALLTATGFPGAFAAADQVNYRAVMVLKDGREFTNTNTTPNITGGQFYSASFLYTLTVRAVTAGSWIGAYTLTQNSIWSPNHSAALHARSDFPSYLNKVLFPNQTVNLTIPTGGLSSERQFTVSYRGQNVTLRVNLENGAVFIPLQNSTVDCSTEREIYWTFPTAGTFVGSTALPLGLPQGTVSNRGAYSTAITGLLPGAVMTIGLDDDADEYGRRNGYCTWVRRIALTLTKI